MVVWFFVWLFDCWVVVLFGCLVVLPGCSGCSVVWLCMCQVFGVLIAGLLGCMVVWFCGSG